MITLTNERSNQTVGKTTRHWDVLRDGVKVALLSKTSEAFAKWRLYGENGTRELFGNKDAAMLFAVTL